MSARTLAVLFATVLVLLGPACTSSKLDSSRNNVVLQVSEVQIPPINATLDATSGICSFRITESTATLEAVLKADPGDLTGSPGLDVLIESLTISYVWDDGLITPPYTTSPRIVVPAGEQNQVRFNAIPLEELINAASPRDGHSAEITMVFRGSSFDGGRVDATGGAPLIVNSCQ